MCFSRSLLDSENTPDEINLERKKEAVVIRAFMSIAVSEYALQTDRSFALKVVKAKLRPPFFYKAERLHFCVVKQNEFACTLDDHTAPLLFFFSLSPRAF